jgi:hypothetical protein
VVRADTFIGFDDFFGKIGLMAGAVPAGIDAFVDILA